MNKEQKLRSLEERNKVLRPIVSKGFDTSEELDAYIQGISEIYNEYYDNQEKIEKIKWELKTPKEKEEELELLRKMKLKREGKLDP